MRKTKKEYFDNLFELWCGINDVRDTIKKNKVLVSKLKKETKSLSLTVDKMLNLFDEKINNIR